MSIIKFNNQNVSILIKKDLRWQTISFDGGKVFFRGEKDFIIKIFEQFKKNKYDLKKIKKLLLQLNSCSSAIFFNKKYCICFTDLCRSYPIFFNLNSNSVLFSNSSERFKKQYNIDQESLNYIKLCGYSLGYGTILKNIKIMKPGEIFYSDNKNLKLAKYFEYHVTTKKNKLSKKKIKNKIIFYSRQYN